MWITGQVVDESGRALPGVSVEASGPAAANKRAVVSNSQGWYVMQDLRPGTYTITFARAGFSTLRRQTDALSVFVSTINAQLQAGAP